MLPGCGASGDFGDWISILFHAPLREHISAPPFMVYGIENPAAGGGVLVLTDAADRWIRGIAWHPQRGESIDDSGHQRCTALLRSAAWIPALPVKIVEVCPFQMTAAIADRYRAGRAVPAGDAAHVFTPTTGMRLNLALHDARVAARLLADAIEHDDQPATLDQYKHACRPLAEKLLQPELADA